MSEEVPNLSPKPKPHSPIMEPRAGSKSSSAASSDLASSTSAPSARLCLTGSGSRARCGLRVLVLDSVEGRVRVSLSLTLMPESQHVLRAAAGLLKVQTPQERSGRCSLLVFLLLLSCLGRFRRMGHCLGSGVCSC